MFDTQLPALTRLGWRPSHTQQFIALTSNDEAEPCVPARITKDLGQSYVVATADGTRRAALTGRLLESVTPESRPTVGDWVAIRISDPLSLVTFCLERDTVLMRKAAGGTSEGQVVAANVDLAFVVSALPPPDTTVHVERRALNPNRIRRYLQLTQGAGLRAVLLVNKADLNPEAEQLADELQQLFPEQQSILVSAHSGVGLEAMNGALAVGETAVLLGSSGVGKSSLTNRLLGQAAQHVAAIREDDVRGRHTTTTRDLFTLPGGGLLIDTPGMRELALWADTDSKIDQSNRGLEEYVDRCRFRDCGHTDEPGCAVREAISLGELDETALEQQRKLGREVELQRERHDALERHRANKRRRTFSKMVRRAQRDKER